MNIVIFLMSLLYCFYTSDESETRNFASLDNYRRARSVFAPQVIQHYTVKNSNSSSLFSDIIISALAGMEKEKMSNAFGTNKR